MARKANSKEFVGSITWCFLNRGRATHSPKEALWAVRIGQTVRKETGYRRVWTFGLYLCVAWGGFSHPNAPEFPTTTARAVHVIETMLVGIMEALAIPHLCELHDHDECVGGKVRRRCVDHWQAVWRCAHRTACKRICEGIDFGGAEIDVLRMLRLFSDALVPEPTNPVSRKCDLTRFHAWNGFLLEKQDAVRSVINHLLGMEGR